jgi:UDP-N-acetylmuramoylalanine--D-glutamate ligase
MTGRFAGERAVVVGFGVSGRAAARVLRDEGAEVRVSEARPAGALADPEGEPLSFEGLEILAGGHRPEHLDGATLVMVSPGIPEGAPVIGWAADRGLPVWGELELGARVCRIPYVSITGTNGKTTTSELVASMMRAAGISVRTCGNVGYPFPLAAREPFDALVVEASSFQLRFQERFHPRVSALLNLAPDHLDWHGSFEGYVDAKARIFRNQTGDDVHVGNRDDAEAARVSRGAPCEVRWFGLEEPEPGDVGVRGDRVVYRPGHGASGAVDVGAPASVRRAFLSDAAAAAAVSLAFGLPTEAVGEAMATFVPLPHRGTVVAQIGSVRFVDDSKATNVHAALAAMEDLTDAVLIAGGLAKGVDLTPLAAGAPALAAVVAIGEAAPQVAAVFAGIVAVHRAGSMDEAVRMAFDEAPPHGTVLLAPACASFDMFRDYRERGERFALAARALARSESRRSHA